MGLMVVMIDIVKAAQQVGRMSDRPAADKGRTFGDDCWIPQMHAIH